MSNESDPLNILDSAAAAISKPLPTGDKALAEQFGRANARLFVLVVVVAKLTDQPAKETLLGILNELVFVGRDRELPPGRHITAAQDEFLSLYSWLLGEGMETG